MSTAAADKPKDTWIDEVHACISVEANVRNYFREWLERAEKRRQTRVGSRAAKGERGAEFKKIR